MKPGRDLTPRHRRRRGLAAPAVARSRRSSTSPTEPGRRLRRPGRTPVRHRAAALGRLGLATRPALRVLVLLAMLAGLVALVRQPAFAAADVEVAGLHHLGRAAVLRGAGLSGRPSVLLVSPDRAAAAIGADPWVRQVSVEALLPDTVRVTVVEWTPAAVLTAGAGAWLLTEQGTVLGPAQGAAPALVIHGPARALHPRDRAIPARLVADLDRIRAAFPADFGLTLTAFELDGGGRLVADTNGPRILFGQMVTEDQIDSLDAKLGALASLRAQVDLLRSGFDYINLMNPQQPATHVPPPSPSPSPSARPAPAASPGHH